MKVSNKENISKNNSPSNFKIIKLSAAWVIIAFCVISLLIFSTRISADAINNQRMITEKSLRCMKLAEQMQSGSDILTNAVWRFVATGQEEYAKEYLAEREVNLSRDRALEALREEGLEPVELVQMEEAMQLSDQLMLQELSCMRLTYESRGIEELPPAIAAVEMTEEESRLSAGEKKSRAMEFVFGDDYKRIKGQIETEIGAFTDKMSNRQDRELQEAMEQTENSQMLQRLTAVLLLVWCLGYMVFFYYFLIRPIHSSCLALLDPKNQNHELQLQGPYELQSLIAAFNDAILHIRDKNEEIFNIQMVDPVTGGFTSTRFDMEAVRFLHEEREFAFVSLDIRRFKLINDVYGSDTGDEVLKTVYEAVCGCLRQEECVSRIQSDMFNLILFETDVQKIEKRIEEINQVINCTYSEKGQREYHLSMNCGIYQVVKGDLDIVSIRDRANVARKINKSEAEYLTGCVFYTDLEREHLLREQVMENEMEHALYKEEFLVYLQPKVRLSDGKVIGSEALVRWKSDSFGMIPPNDFIPLFEKNGFILKLDYYMFTQVCRLLRKWIDSGKEVMPISVNLSRKHLEENGFIGRFEEIQKSYSVPCDLIEFELTEAMVFEDLPRLKVIIAELHKAGYRCSMDDFGSGYSSLNVLKEIPVDILKMDRGFFVGGDTERGTNVVKAVIQMAKELNMQVVAEGVETSKLVEFLKIQGCDMVQGYVFYRPMPVAEFVNEILDVVVKEEI